MEQLLRMEYTVRHGEHLRDILKRFRVTAEIFYAMNPTVGEVSAGETVQIPLLWRVCPEGLLYRLEKGETLTAVAQRFGMTLFELLSLNPYLAPFSCVPGQVIVVRDHSGAVSGD